MGWAIETSAEFKMWYEGLSDDEQEDVDFSIEILEQRGHNLGRPHVDSVYGSRHSNLKELRIQHRGRPYRVLFAFDPRQVAYLILGGDKTGDNRWYEKSIKAADKIYDRHLAEIKR
jgi:hypothetical protein